MPPRRSLIATVTLTIALLAAANVAVRRLAENSVPRQLLHRIRENTPADLVAVGNSVIAAGFDCEAFDQAMAASGRQCASMNAGLGATGPAQHLVVTRAILAARPATRDLVYGFFDFMLTDPTQTTWWEYRGNNAISFYLEPEVAARHLASSAAGRAAFRSLHWFPLFTEREALWARVERLRRTLGGLGLPARAVNAFGRVEDFAGLAESDAGALRDRARELVSANTPLTPAVREMLEECRKQGVRPWLVAMPLAPSQMPGRDSPEWRAYLERLSTELARYDARLMDAGAWVREPDLFMDSLHLTPAGARQFSRRLAVEMSQADGP